MAADVPSSVSVVESVVQPLTDEQIKQRRSPMSESQASALAVLFLAAIGATLSDRSPDSKKD